MTDDWTAARVERVRSDFGQAGIDALFVSAPENFAYLSGFMALDRAGMLLVTPNARLLLTNFLYAENAAKAAPGWEIVPDFPIRFRDPLDAFRDRLKALGVRRLGFESRDVSVWLYDVLRAELGEAVTLVPTDGLVEAARARKDAEELARIRAAVAIADAAFEHFVGWVRPGLTERQAAWELERFMRAAGAEAMAFEVNVSSGPNSAIPHHRPTERELRPDEPVLVDMGARRDGYCSDITRTFWLGAAPPRFRELWALVEQANALTRQGLRVGQTGAEADGIARRFLASHGHGDDVYPHGVGHGVGLAIHEAPWLLATARGTLEAGNVFTVEPGIYLPGWGGVRLEDMGVLTAMGFETFTQASKPVEVLSAEC